MKIRTSSGKHIIKSCWFILMETLNLYDIMNQCVLFQKFCESFNNIWLIFFGTSTIHYDYKWLRQQKIIKRISRLGWLIEKITLLCYLVFIRFVSILYIFFCGIFFPITKSSQYLHHAEVLKHSVNLYSLKSVITCDFFFWGGERHIRQCSGFTWGFALRDHSW